MSGAGEDDALPEAEVRRSGRFSLIWLIPLIAGAIAVYLAVDTLINRGPLITISFRTANGITAGETQVKHKSVALGTVEEVHLSHDFSHVLVHVRMNRQGTKVLTSHARFWVVRPRLTPGNISGLETLVSGAYIEVDPGVPGGSPQRKFTGLEDPPAMRSDEPGHSYTLKAARLGSLGPGSPVFYRDVAVGEVLSYDLGNGLGPVTIKVFVHEPYDRFVNAETHFWNASGISINLGPEGVHAEFESIQAVLGGGVAFETPRRSAGAGPSPNNTTFVLYDSKASADQAGFQTRLPFVAYFQSSVRGLARGSAVEVFGIQVGIVDEVHLMLNPATGQARARVAFEVQPERVFSEQEVKDSPPPEQVARLLVQKGMRAVLDNSNLITGQKVISLQYVPAAPAADLGHEGDALVVPAQGGGLDNITAALSDIGTKLQQIPFDQIGRNLDHMLASLDRTVSGPEMRDSMRNLSATLAEVRRLVRNTETGLQPALARLPRISEELQQVVHRANEAVGQGGYGNNSDFQRSLERLMDQVNDAARSIRLLADFLDRHPEALIRGRSAQDSGR